MTHLFISREYPPAGYPPGGIGTYLQTIARLLARAGETVHVIAHRWSAACEAKEVSPDGRLTVHRVALDSETDESPNDDPGGHIARGMLASAFPSQAFSWRAALLAEHLVDREGIDVIEAQEWEAPLYYFQCRRELNLGPARRPPCVVHLHSSTEQIFKANEWDSGVDDFPPAVAMEKYSITNADAVVCPSHFMAEHAFSRYGLDRSVVRVIRYPLGQVPQVERSLETWSSGSVCHIGRLEPRKGVLEWADAIAAVGAEYTGLTFDFVGSDTPLGSSGSAMVGDAIRARVPPHVRRRLVFHGPQDSARVVDTLRRAWAAVVPSRWENLPYSCLESMATGLPVIVSPTGGMTEIVEDGVSGWIAPDASSAGLAAALRRAAATTATERARLGAAAAATVRRVCDNDEVVRSHLDLKRRLAERRATVPTQVMTTAPPPADGMVVVIKGAAKNEATAEWLASLGEQTETPESVHAIPETSQGDLGDATIALLGALDSQAAGIVFVDAGARLTPDCLAICRRLFDGHDRVGLISAWTRYGAGEVVVQPNPEVPYLLEEAGIAPFVAVRLSALRDVMRVTDHRRRSVIGIFESVEAAGWVTLTYPSVLSTRRGSNAPRRAARYSPIARAVRRSHTPVLEWLFESSTEEILALMRQALVTPARSAVRLLKRTARE